MKKIITIIITFILVAGGAFYAGMKYGQSKSSVNQFSRPNFQNLSLKDQQQRFQRMGNQTGSGFASGEIIAKDDKSITIKLPNGGSKIIFYSAETEIGKFIKGTPEDLEIGKSVIVNGKANSDGSITSQTIQLRPER